MKNGNASSVESVGKDFLVTARSGHGTDIHAALRRLTRYHAVFEIYDPAAVLQVSEVLKEFKIAADDVSIYSGRAVVTNLMQMGTGVTCEVKLDEPGAQTGIHTPGNGSNSVMDAYNAFFVKWQGQVKIQPEFKLAVLDLQGYLWDLKLLLEQIELSIPANPSRSRADIELEIARDLSGPVLSCIDNLHEKFEEAAQEVQPELRWAHEALVRRQLHPLFLCAPFGLRTYQKPLGYPGDFEIMNMIHRQTFEGASLYAKLVHYWLVNQWAAKSVRNRIAYMKARLVDEVAKAARERHLVRILNVGCGPAREVQDFLAECRLADFAEITLLDFDAAALDYAVSAVHEMKRRYDRQTSVEIRKTSVTDLIKDASRSRRNSQGEGFDLIYCGGLYDYFSDRVCKQLTGLMYNWLAPGGRMVLANMDDRQKPFRHMVEYLLDWHLIYRDTDCLSSFVPEETARDNWRVVSEPLSVNLFLEIGKPKD